MLVEKGVDRFMLTERAYPHYVKYMGSKSAIMDFVLEGINSVYSGGAVCDLFAGSASLAGAIGHLVPVHSNDIQAYSEVLAQAYLQVYRYKGMPTADEILEVAEKTVYEKTPALGHVIVDYKQDFSLEEFAAIELAQQKLIDQPFSDAWHLFTKYYSGTWWSAEQCLWIDAIRQAAERFRQSPSFPLILSSLMYAMAYTSQGTGHYAQYRDAKTTSSLRDIVIYRRREVSSYFRRKYMEVAFSLSDQPPAVPHKTTTLDFKDCLKSLSGGTVYADPPYCFVHYSRFYHAIETLVLYDYPEIQVKGGKVVKGRYREGRHQSPFCIATQVKQAFRDLFTGVMESSSSLVLSYSNTGMISPGEIEQLIEECCPGRGVEIVLTNHQHMTLGRQKDRHRDVEECLFLVR
ncbi:DNA adenine methylase [Vogesella sp. AC12]|uniref:DNA adenine methylase n=1 Tax=Vogesella sp. AC12 TaxID=2950550 RepID=UPI00210A37AC|nr:DNA adenine methylase [Vogesella sp. AC12]MCQ4145804.1 DNA adenine methylase [Vogesella sp. AC12]